MYSEKVQQELWEDNIHFLVGAIQDKSPEWSTFYLTFDGPDEFLVEEVNSFAGSVPVAEYRTVEELEALLSLIEEGPDN